MANVTLLLVSVFAAFALRIHLPSIPGVTVIVILVCVL